MAADWTKIRLEYVTSQKKISLRKLAEKYHVPESSLFQKSSLEQWIEQREHYQGKVEAKTLEKMSNNAADRASAIAEAADALLERTINSIKTSDYIPATAAKNYSDALKNIKEIHDIKPSLDIEEQQARIEKLRREAEKEDRNTSITINLEGVCDYAE